MNRRIATNLAMSLACCLTVSGCDRGTDPTITKPTFANVERGPGADDLEIWPVELERLRVFAFVRTDCPIANRYTPEIKALQSIFDDIAQFVLVYPAERETMQQIEIHAELSLIHI